jgi:hypothetical protein
MVTAADMRIIAERWKRATRPLKIHDQEYGNRLAIMLEGYNGEEIKRFDDPLEAAAYIVLIGMFKYQDICRNKSR